MNKSRFGLAFLSLAWVGVAVVSVASAGTVTIASPANGVVVASPVTVAAQVDSTTCNSGFNHLQVLVNGVTSYTGDCAISAPISMPQGSDTLSVQAIRWDG